MTVTVQQQNAVTPQEQPAGQPVTPLAQADGVHVNAGQAQAQEPVTLELVKKIVGQEIENNRKMTQQQLDKRETRINQRIDMVKNAAKEAGITMTPEQEKVIAKAARNEVETEESAGNLRSGEPQGQATTPENGKHPDVDDVNQWIDLQIKEFGTDIDKNDPEQAMIQQAIDAKANRFEFAMVYQKALSTKAARIAPPAKPPQTGIFMGSGSPGKTGIDLNASSWDLLKPE